MEETAKVSQIKQLKLKFLTLRQKSGSDLNLLICIDTFVGSDESFYFIMEDLNTHNRACQQASYLL